jgi:hypothetical protein
MHLARYELVDPRIFHKVRLDAIHERGDRHRDGKVVVVIGIVALQHQGIGSFDRQAFDRDVGGR